ncbi:hypothetical protein PHLGIDRAFT_348784 [Phlebiopsis gigantea 11061_1 CR5-6]|uniref:Uncharacterized protein n=1 Tax=Phlebiopsis gigantea (strain 11061_1 CR5-6) TaxID=745531 RepID=A0A0C3S1Y0_PHLG1|nr:hypothetical protein PHLGIDRAFT_348784 [Phlebiopsis gigantea 11061_1 CR5-6]
MVRWLAGSQSLIPSVVLLLILDSMLGRARANFCRLSARAERLRLPWQKWTCRRRP